MKPRKEKFRVLLLGSGGRESALAWAFARSPHLEQLYINPGNPGTAEWGINVRPELKTFEEIKTFCREKHIDFVVPGPEAPLVNGVYDALKNDSLTASVAVIGPSQQGAMLEGSKAFAKAFMQRHGIPTAPYHVVERSTLYEGFKILDRIHPPFVLKADGLAGGKGVLLLDNVDDAKRELAFMVGEKKFGEAGRKVLIEEFLRGVECSVFVFTDGHSYRLLPEAKDYKRIGEGNTGPNTGGMGAISPVPFVDEAFMRKVILRIVEPTLKGLRQEGILYKGFLYFGLMNVEGNPYVVEYNCRLGDPEAEAILSRVITDWVLAFEAVHQECLQDLDMQIDPRASAAVVLASQGYPDHYDTGFLISGLDVSEGVQVFHAGTKADGGRVFTAGGRVLVVNALAPTLSEALNKCYQAAARIHFDNKYYRRDIGRDVLS